MRAAACLLAAAAFAVALLAGCGSSGSGPITPVEFSAAAANCETPHFEGSYDKVHIAHGKISCAEATSMILLLASGGGPQTIELHDRTHWTCTALPPARRPLEERCRHGREAFTVERVQDRRAVVR